MVDAAGVEAVQRVEGRVVLPVGGEGLDQPLGLGRPFRVEGVRPLLAIYGRRRLEIGRVERV